MLEPGQRPAGRLSVYQALVEPHHWYVRERHAGRDTLVDGPFTTRGEAERRVDFVREIGVRE